MIIEKPILGQITQGSIFTAATAENYLGHPVWGLCITARCDVAHETKTQTFNYVPIVRYDDWLLKDGGKLLVEKIYVDLFNNAKNKMANIGKSNTVLDSYDPKTVAEKYFPLNEQKGPKASNKFHELADQLVKINKIRSDNKVEIEELKEICEYQMKIAEKRIRDLLSNQLPGYYFLSTIGETENDSLYGYVVLLREIHHISRSTATAIGKGITQQDYKESSDLNTLCFSCFDFSYSTGILKSPWIEHLMQQFSTLFSRIGLPDPASTSFHSLCEAIKK
jgi:hypothetical protein